LQIRAQLNTASATSALGLCACTSELDRDINLNF
jgi:hypothetical protein